MTRRRGRPATELTPALVAQIAAAARRGGSIRAAAGACGVSRSALSNWLRAGEADPTGPYAALLAAWEAALAAFEARHLAVIAKGGTGWQASAWLLERRFPSEWARSLGATVPAVSRVEIGEPTPRIVIKLPSNGRE